MEERGGNIYETLARLVEELRRTEQCVSRMVEQGEKIRKFAERQARSLRK